MKTKPNDEEEDETEDRDVLYEAAALQGQRVLEIDEVNILSKMPSMVKRRKAQSC